MKELDFLPASFHEVLRRRYQTRRNVLYSVALVVALGGIHQVHSSRLRSAQASLVAVQTAHKAHDAQRAHLEALKTKKQTLQNKLALLSQLEDDAPLDAITGEITRLMNDVMGLQSVLVETSPKDKADQQENDPLLDRGTTRVELVGVAVNDVEMGRFFGRLEECPLFKDVTMSFSREIRQAGREMTNFKFGFSVKRVALGQ